MILLAASGECSTKIMCPVCWPLDCRLGGLIHFVKRMSPLFKLAVCSILWIDWRLQSKVVGRKVVSTGKFCSRKHDVLPPKFPMNFIILFSCFNHTAASSVDSTSTAAPLCSFLAPRKWKDIGLSLASSPISGIAIAAFAMICFSVRQAIR